MTTPSDESPFSKMITYSQEWQDIWLNVIEKTQKDLVAFCGSRSREQKTPSSQSSHNAVFDLDIMAKTVATVLPKLFENPQKMMDLHQQHIAGVRQIWQNMADQRQDNNQTPSLFQVDTRDKRFRHPQWRENPSFVFLQQLYLLNANLLQQTMDQVQGVDDQTRKKLDFYTKHLIDAMSPTNFPMTNPDVIEKTFESKGENLIQGYRNYLQHVMSEEITIPMTDMSAFTLGENLAATPGKVVYRNDLFELIHYAATTEKVCEIPLLIIPPWINKYYIFDLREDNSFAKWMVDSGLSVFIVSWVNPDERHANKTLSDFVLDGALTALNRVIELTKKPSINVLGYCTGGVLLNCLLSYLRQKRQKKIISASFLASPVDFKEAGDLLVFVCEQQLKKLEQHLEKKGFLEGQKMVQAFNLLRANDLIWSSYVNNYLMGKNPTPFDMLYWNCDAVRMPANMHVTFLRQMYLENRLLQPGGVTVDGGVKVDIAKNNVPTFIMAAIDDHIAPWKSIFPMLKMIKGPKKFVLAGSGHVAGVVNPPARKKYHYWSADFNGERAEDWAQQAQKIVGSWWPEWREWLQPYSGEKTTPPSLNKKDILGEAPGTYVKVMGG